VRIRQRSGATGGVELAVHLQKKKIFSYGSVKCTSHPPSHLLRPRRAQAATFNGFSPSPPLPQTPAATPPHPLPPSGFLVPPPPDLTAWRWGHNPPIRSREAARCCKCLVDAQEDASVPRRRRRRPPDKTAAACRYRRGRSKAISLTLPWRVTW
jgi:hypothetical protein